MEQLLKQIINNTEPKRSFSIVVSENKTRLKAWFKPPSQLDKKKDYEIALINLETYYSFQNIYNLNNYVTYTPSANALWYNIIIPEGSYYDEDINEFIQREMRKTGHYDKANDKDNIEISAHTNILKSEMFLRNKYEVDFRQYNSINCLLGFDSKLYTSGFHESEDRLNILTSNSNKSILILFQVVMSMVPHNLQFTRSFQMSLLGIKLSKILIIFFTFQ